MKGVPLVYSNLSPGLSIGCSPTTPSPLTSHGQKGSGEGGYLGAPAAIASAVNDALGPLGLVIEELPMRMHKIEALIHNGTTK